MLTPRLCLHGGDVTADTPAADLVATLRSPSATQKEKADACLFLARVGTLESVPVLVELLPDAALSHMARYALEPMPFPEVDTAFRAALSQLTGRQLIGVIDSIGVRRDPKAIAALSGLLRATEPDVAQAAARALGSIGTRESVKSLEKALAQISPANRLAFCEGLLRCAERLQASGDTRGALSVFDGFRPDTSLPPQVQVAAWRGAILIRGDQGLPLLQEALRSDRFLLVESAARTALELPSPKVTRTLTQALTLPPADRQVLILQILAQRADPACLPQVLELARKAPAAVRIAAIRALPPIIGGETGRTAGPGRGIEPAVEGLTALLFDPDREVAQAAQESLAALPGPAADAAVMSMLTSGTTAAQLTGIELAGRRRMAAAVPQIARMASGPVAELRPAAFKKLGELASPSFMDELVSMLMSAQPGQDLDAAEQAVAAVCLKAESTEPAVRRFAALLPGADLDHKLALLNLLGTLGGPGALGQVRMALDHPDPAVRTAALRVLGTWKSPDAVPVLLVYARSANKPEDRLLCLRGYLGWASQPELPIPERLTICRESAALITSPEEKRLFLAASGTIPSPDALTLINAYLAEETLREEAAAAYLAVAAALLEGDQDKAIAPQLIEPLRRISQQPGDANRAKRAQELLKSAEAKSAN